MVNSGTSSTNTIDVLPVKTPEVRDQSVVARELKDFKLETIEGPIRVICDRFGYIDTEDKTESNVIKRYTFYNTNKMSVQVISYGATITSMKVPNRCGSPEEILMGFDGIEGYRKYPDMYFGSTIGRVSHRIDNGIYNWDSKEYILSKNENGLHHFNGGKRGFDKINWTASLHKNILTLAHVSISESEGYPGSVMTRATFELRNNNSFHVTYSATTTKATPINLTNHLSFNLAGHNAGHKELYKHVLMVNGDRRIILNEAKIPTGQIQCVGGTIDDFRIPRELGPAIARCPGGGYENFLCVTQGTEQELTFVARVIHPGSGRVLELYSDQLCVQLETCNDFPDPYDDIHPPETFTQDYYEIPRFPTSITISTYDEKKSIVSKSPKKKQIAIASPSNMSLDNERNKIVEVEEEEEEPECICSICSCHKSETCTCSDLQEPIEGSCGALYMKHGAFSLNTQNYPDAVNNKNFPNIILLPGDTYKHEIVYRFGIHLGIPCQKAVYIEEVRCEEMEEEEILY